MKAKPFIFVIVPALTLLASERSDSTLTVRDVIFINIQGRTNINSFKFFLNNTPASGTGKVARPETGMIQKDGMSIPIKKLQTDHEYMYSDFLKLLKEPEFPEIFISIDDTFIRDINKEPRDLSTFINITMAGMTNRYGINIHLEDLGEEVALNGTVQLKLTDFNLEPPTKMLGLIRVRDEIDIDFSVLFDVQSEKR